MNIYHQVIGKIDIESAARSILDCFVYKFRNTNTSEGNILFLNILWRMIFDSQPVIIRL